MDEVGNMLTIVLIGGAIGYLLGKLAPQTAARFSRWSQKPELWKLHALSTVLFSLGLALAIADMNVKQICISMMLVALCGSAMLSAWRRRSA